MMKAKPLPYLIFILLLVISFRYVLATPGIVGHTWDWGIPNFPEQFWDQFRANLYTWDGFLDTGRFHYFKLELFYSLVLLPFSFMGGEFVSKIFPMVLLFLAGCTMFKLSREMFGLSRFFAGLSGVFYMFSPVAYSKLIAGHLPMIWGYSILPIFVFALLKILQTLRTEHRLSGRHIVLGGLTLGMEWVHTSFGMSSMAIFSSIFLIGLIRIQQRGRLCAAAAAVIAIFVLLNSFWIVPFIKDNISTGAMRHGWGLSAAKNKVVTVKSELPMREAYLKSSSQPILSLLPLKIRMGMDTEYVYPSPVPRLWILSGVAIALLSFAALLLTKEPEVHALVVTGFLGLTLVAALKTLVGVLIYQVLFKNFVPIVYEAFSNSNRALPLVVISYAVLAPYTLSRLHDKFAGGQKAMILKVVSVAVFAVFISPFISGKLTEPQIKGSTQPMSLKITKVNREDRQVYDLLRSDKRDFRVSYMPPSSLSWPGDTDLSYEWIQYSPKTAFPAWYNHPLGYAIMSNLYSRNPSPYLGKLLGLASVRYIVYPHYDFFISYIDFLPDMPSRKKVEGFKDYRPIVDRNLRLQKGFAPSNFSFRTVDIWENKYFLPHIYAAPTFTVVSGDVKTLINMAGASGLNGYPAICFTDDNNMDVMKNLSREMTVPINGEASVPAISFSKVNSTRYIVDVKGARRPFPLVFSESFDEGWKAYIRRAIGAAHEAIGMQKGEWQEEPWSALWSAWKDKGNRTEIKGHFVVNGYANGWIVPINQLKVENLKLKGEGQNSGEDFQIVLEFKPQRLFEAGLLVSAITLTGCLGYLGYDLIRRKKRINCDNKE